MCMSKDYELHRHHALGEESRVGPLSHLQMETVTKILIKMCPLSTDGAILILAFYTLSPSVVLKWIL